MRQEQVQQAQQGDETQELATVRRILQAHENEPGALLPILHDVQDALGHIPANAVPVIAEAQNLSRAEVHGVVTYYHHFRSQPPGRHVVQVCRAEACQSAGCEALADHLVEKLGIEFGETTPDGRVTLEPVYCLGLCSIALAAMIDGRLVARLDATRLDKALEEVVR